MWIAEWVTVDAGGNFAGNGADFCEQRQFHQLLAAYARGGELARGRRTAAARPGTALNESLLFFHASAAVRSLIYETVLTAAVSGDDITFKELLELALFALCYARFQGGELRTYKRKVKEVAAIFWRRFVGRFSSVKNRLFAAIGCQLFL